MPASPHNLPSAGRQILAGRLWRTGLLLGGAAAARASHSPEAALRERWGLAEPRARRCGPAKVPPWYRAKYLVCARPRTTGEFLATQRWRGYDTSF